MDSIQFIAALKPTGKCIKLDSDMATEITLSIPETELANAVRLVTLKGLAFRVTIEPLEVEG